MARGIRINSPTDVKRLIARTINDVKKSDEINDKDKAQLIATLSNTMLRAMETVAVNDNQKKKNNTLAELTGMIANVYKTMNEDEHE